MQLQAPPIHQMYPQQQVALQAPLQVAPAAPVQQTYLVPAQQMVPAAPPMNATYVTLTTKFNHRKAYKPDYVCLIAQKFDERLEEGLEDDLGEQQWADEGPGLGSFGSNPRDPAGGKVMSSDSEDEVIRGNVRGRHQL